MRILVALLALALLPGAAAKMMWDDAADGGIEELIWHADSNGTEIAWSGVAQELRIMVFAGSPGSDAAWILVHIGNETRAYDAAGEVPVTSRDDGNHTILTLPAMQGDCIVAVAQALAWDHGYTVTDAVPDGAGMAWNDGDLCDGVVDVPETVAKETKKSPLPLVWVIAALAVARKSAPTGI